jgi:hypothetical protein
MKDKPDIYYITGAENALEGAKAGLARGCASFVIDRRGAENRSYQNAAADIMALSFLADMEADARIETDTETVYMLSGVRKSYYDFLMEMEGAKEPSENEPGRLTIPSANGGSFAVLSWEERSEGVSVTGAEPELTDAVLTHSYPVHTNFTFRGDGSAEISLRRGRLLVIVTYF